MDNQIIILDMTFEKPIHEGVDGEVSVKLLQATELFWNLLFSILLFFSYF